MKKDMSLEGLRWSCDSGSALYDTPPNGRSRTGWGGDNLVKMCGQQHFILKNPQFGNILYP